MQSTGSHFCAGVAAGAHRRPLKMQRKRIKMSSTDTTYTKRNEHDTVSMLMGI